MVVVGGETWAVPARVCEPSPEMETSDAPCSTRQLKVADSPSRISIGSAVKLRMRGAPALVTVTVAVAETLPALLVAVMR